MSDDTVQLFCKSMVQEVEDGLTPETPFSTEVFTRLILEKLEEVGHLNEAFDLFQEGRLGRAIYRIDGYSFDEESTKLELFTTIYHGESTPVRVPAADANRAFDRALRFVKACVDGLASQLEPSNTDASDLARRIESEAKTLNVVRIILLTDGLLSGALPGEADWSGRSVQFDSYDIVRLKNVLGDGETRADISVDFVALTGAALPCLYTPSSDGGYDAYLAVLSGEVLSKVYERYGVRLLELNVRAFLGLQGRKSVNSELRRTIVDRPSMFLAFNNGIVATVDEIEMSEHAGAGASIRSMKGLQIVNGGQTTASLHRARRKESLSLEHVSVPIKVIKVGGADLTEMVTSISRAANRQNTVQLADFSANDPFHQQVETLANNTWLDDGKGRWFYERARGAYLAAEQKATYRKSERESFPAVTPKQRRLSKLDVARCLAAWSGLPHRVCLGGQKNFQHFMQRLKDEPPPPMDQAWFKKMVAIAILYRSVERTVRAMKFPAYTAQIVAYIVSGISYRTGGRIDFGRIWSNQAVSPLLDDLVRAWAPQIDAALRASAGSRNPGEWFKKADCWDTIRGGLPMLSEPLPPELSFSVDAGAPGGDIRTPGISVDDYNRIARCMEVDGATWLAIAERGQRNGIIHYKVAGICRTLASYAAGGWERKPSVKQAKPALDALKAVEEASLVPARNSGS